MANPIKIDELAALIKLRRGDTGLRELAVAIDVSASTLSRIEQGNIPDLETYVKICRWLGVPTERFLESEGSTTQKEIPESEIIMAHLRADKVLKPETRAALEQVIKLAYLEAKEMNRKKGKV